MRFITSLLLSFCFVAPVVASDSISVISRPFAFQTEHKPVIEKRIGELQPLGMVELLSDDPRFGGLSGIDVSTDGLRWVMVSDRGYLLRGAFMQENGKLSGVQSVSIHELRDRNGEPMDTLHRDAEAVIWKLERSGNALLADLTSLMEGIHSAATAARALVLDEPLPTTPQTKKDNFLVGLEREDRVEYYAVEESPEPAYVTPQYTIKPPVFKNFPFNQGLESITLLRDGRLFALGEGTDSGAWLLQGWNGDSIRVNALNYAYHNEFHPSDMTTLPNGDVLVLERRATLMAGFSVRILHIPAADLHYDATIRGREIARIEAPYAVDNMEGIAAYEAEDGQIHIYLVSDDNYRLWQRTLLMEFVWK